MRQQKRFRLRLKDPENLRSGCSKMIAKWRAYRSKQVKALSEWCEANNIQVLKINEVSPYIIVLAPSFMGNTLFGAPDVINVKEL